jgi:hypothetical protein
MTPQGKPRKQWKSRRKANPECPAKVMNNYIYFKNMNSNVQPNDMFNMYKSLLISNINERIFSMPGTLGMAENIKVYFTFYVTESLGSHYVWVMFSGLSLTLDN